MSTALAKRDEIAELPSASSANAIVAALETLRAIRTFIAEEFREGTDFGKIPGCGDKPTLFLPGAQKASMYFNSYPTYKIKPMNLERNHVEFRVRCILVSRATGQQIGEGIGCCSTMEKKYRWRGTEIACPSCNAPAIRRSKDKPEFYCWRKINGCGQTFKLNHPAIVAQGNGVPVENPDIHDTHNTVLKMAKKRAHVDAAMTLACLSELFTQDIEDTYAASQVREATRPQDDGIIDGEVVDEYRPTPPEPKRYSARPDGEKHPNGSGHATGMYASPEQIKAFLEWLGAKVSKHKTKWNATWKNRIDQWLDDGLAVPDKIPDLTNVYECNGHLLKWAVNTGRLDPSIVPEEAKVRQLGAYVAIVFHRSDEDLEALKIELVRYVAMLAAQFTDDIYRKNPDIRPQGWAEEQTEAASEETEAGQPEGKGEAYEGDLATAEASR